MFSLDRIAWSLKESVRVTAKLSETSTTSSDTVERAMKLKFLYAADSHSQNVVNFKTYRLLNKSHIYNGKVAARTGKYANHMKTMMKTYKFDAKTRSHY